MSKVRGAQYDTEVLFVPSDTGMRAAQHVVEVLQTFTGNGAAPAGLFGAAGSQKVVEVLVSVPEVPVRQSQYVVEVLFQEAESASAGGGTVSFGHAV